MFLLSRTGKIDSVNSPIPPLNMTVSQKCEIRPRFSATGKQAVMLLLSSLYSATLHTDRRCHITLAKATPYTYITHIAISQPHPTPRALLTTPRTHRLSDVINRFRCYAAFT